MKNSLNIITIIVCVWFSWGRTDGAQKRESGEVSFHRIEASSLFPSSSAPCVPSPRASNSKSSLQVVHRHGPCSNISSEKARTSPDHDEILRLDEARVKSINSKLSKKRTSRHRVRQNQPADLPAREVPIGSGNYIVTVGIGTPETHDLSLVFDTSNVLTWTQCEPCGGNGSCYPQKDPIFNPSSSSSYSTVSCITPVCHSLISVGLCTNCSGSNCIYRIEYGEYSFTTGFLADETFTIANTDVLHNVSFGCGQNNQGLFEGVAGVLGLGHGDLSFAMQTATRYNNIFSYCLPSSPEHTGHLTFGSDGISDSVKYTPLTTVGSTYSLTIVGITVDNKEMKFNGAGTLMDSTTMFTRLPADAYAALRTAFKEKMSNYTTTPGRSILDTCYDFTGLETVEIPKISIFFEGDAVVDLDSAGILYAFDKSHVCLAFTGNIYDNEFGIFGNVQQKTIQVVYDGAGRRAGFAPNGCK